jgi:uncharacterized membrane protein
VSLTLKRVLILFSVSLNIGFLVYSVWAYMDNPVSQYKAHATIAGEALAQTDAPPDVRQAAQRAIEDFDREIASLHEKMRQSRLRTIGLMAQPGDLPLIELEQVRQDYERMLLERTALLNNHLIKLRQILGPEASPTYFGELRDRLKIRFERK